MRFCGNEEILRELRVAQAAVLAQEVHGFVNYAQGLRAHDVHLASRQGEVRRRGEAMVNPP